MLFSRQFRALGKVAGFFASAWGVIGALIGMAFGPSITGGTVLSSVMTFALMYGTAGGIAGIATALLLARAESGRQINDVPAWRLAAWGVVGGMAPAALFSVLGLIAGASLSAVLPLVGLGVVGGAMGGVISGSASAAAKAAPLHQGERLPQLPAA